MSHPQVKITLSETGQIQTITVPVDACCGTDPIPCPPVPCPPAPSASSVMIATLESTETGNFGQPVSLFDYQIVRPSEDAEINSYGSSIKFKSNGWFTVSLTCRVQPVNSNNDVYPYGATVYGSHVTRSLEGRSNHARFAQSDGSISEFDNDSLRSNFGTDSQRVQWHDEFTVEVTDFDSQESAILMYAQKYAGFGHTANYSGVIKVTKIAGPVVTPVV